MRGQAAAMTELLRRAGLLGLGVGVLGVLASMLPPILEVEESLGLGWLFAVRGPLDPPEDVVVVGISRESADAFGIGTDLDDWPRSLHADLIDQLASAGAAVIVFDIIFDKPRTPDGDLRLAEAVTRAGNVILLERVRSEHVELQDDAGSGGAVFWERRVPPIEPLQHGALATAPFTLPVVPIRVGQFWTFGRAAGDTPNLPATALHAYALPLQDALVRLLIDARPELGEALAGLPSGPTVNLQDTIRELRGSVRAHGLLGADLARRVEQGSETPERLRRLRALAALYTGPDSRYLNYYGPARTITTIPYHHAAPQLAEGIAEAVAGKVVFVGFSERRQPEQQDAFISVFSERSGRNLSGVEIGATAFANLLDGTTLRPLPLPAHWVAVLLWGFAVAAVVVASPALVAPAAALAAGALYAAGIAHQFGAASIWGPLFVPLAVQLPMALIAALLWNAHRMRQQRERVQTALGYYLPEGVVHRLARETVSVRSNRELIFGTCLVTDAEQYTTLSEALHPEELGELMNAYYQVLVDAVVKHGGLVSDIAGDSLVAVWPAAKTVGTTHLQACAAAREVLGAVDVFNEACVRRELPTRVGLDSGQLLLGNIGSSRRGEYRAVGDIVNTAARLQGLNRHLGTRVLLSGATADGTAGLVTRRLGRFLLVGKLTPVSVLELQQVGGTPEPSTVELNALFDAALRSFSASRWNEASVAFDAVLQTFPDDGPSRFFRDQCRRLRKLHPDGNWDGVLRMSVK
jgi:adenylate cyclase